MFMCYRCCETLNFLVTDDNATTPTPLAGAVFTVKTANGTVRGSATSDSTGKVVLDMNLKPGCTYTLSETTTPTGYVAMTDAVVKVDCCCNVTVGGTPASSFTSVINAVV